MTTNKNTIGMRVRATLPRAKRAGSVRTIAANIGQALCLGLFAAGIAPFQAVAAEDAAQLSNVSLPLSPPEGTAAPSTIEMQPVVVAQFPKRASFEREHASRDAREVADWVVDSSDNHGTAFVIVDKLNAKVFVFDVDGRLRGAAPALLGLARGDDSVPGIGERKISDIRPEERTTPAGRFVATLGHRSGGEEILWVDYDAAISMHRVINTNLRERRPHRLATPTTADNRISYGCINVPKKFYENVVSPAFTGTNGIVYVLPETRSSRAVFASYDVEEHARAQSASRAVPAQAASQPDVGGALSVAPGITGTVAVETSAVEESDGTWRGGN